MGITARYIVEFGRRRASTPTFYKNSKEYVDSEPRYVQNQITGIELWKMKMKK